MPLNASREREKQASLKSGGTDRGKFWKPENGDGNRIRVMPFDHKVTKEDVAKKLYPKEDLGKTITEWVFPYKVHFGLIAENRKIPVLSTPEIMEAYIELLAQDEAAAKEVKPQNKFAMNIVDMNHPENGVQIWHAGKMVREEIGKYVVDEEYGESVLGIKGVDWKIIYNANAKSPKDYYQIIIQPEKSSKVMKPAIEETVLDLFDPAVHELFVQKKPLSELDMGNGMPTSLPESEVRAPVRAPEKKAKQTKDSDIFDD